MSLKKLKKSANCFEIRIINFQPRNFHTSPLFKQNSILKFQDNICLENTCFSFSSDQHNYEASSTTKDNLIKRFYKAKRYGKYSIIVSAVEWWNKIQKQLKDLLFRDLSPNKIKIIVSDLYLKSYQDSLIKQKLISDFNKRNYCNYQLHMQDFCLLHYWLSSRLVFSRFFDIPGNLGWSNETL